MKVVENIKKRRFVDIYFVLYLAALILLLPDHKKSDEDQLNSDSLQNIENDFHIYPEKTSLMCFVYNDSSGALVQSVDSVNKIYYPKGVKDLEFQFTIENKSLRQKLQISTLSDNEDEFFRILHDESRNLVSFYWLPPNDFKENRNYLVTVNAVGKIDKNGTTRSVKSSTNFSLNLIYEKQSNLNLSAAYISGLDSGVIRLDSSNGTLIIQDSPSPDVNLVINSNKVTGIAYENWNMQVFLTGGSFSKDIFGVPSVKIGNRNNFNGTAELKEIRDNVFYLAGITPYSGELDVEVSVIRKFDKKKLTAYFSVVPQPFRKPEYESIVYPELEYIIKPNLPVIGADIKAILRNKEGILKTAIPGTDIKYIPSFLDTGNILTLDRIIDGNIKDSWTIRVQNYPNPKILRMQEDENKRVRVEIRSYGFYNNSENLSRLELLDGNANIIQKFGTAKESGNRIEHKQIFEITPKYPNKAFNFSIIAVDRMNRKSEIREFKED